MRSVRSSTTAALLGIAVLLPFVAAGCGGGGHGGGNNSNEVVITINTCDTTTYAAFGVICVDFVATGPAGTFDLLPQFIGGLGQAVEDAYQVPPGLVNQLTPPLNPPTATTYTISSNGGQVSGRFCWFAGADLGFVAASNVQFFLTAASPGTTIAIGPSASCPPMNYLGGGQSASGIGPGIGALTGRAGHCGAHVGGKNIVIAGGRGFNGANINSYMTVDRFNIDPNTFTYTNPAIFVKQNRRSDHACSFLLDPATETIRLLVTGGYDAGSGSNVAFATADVYAFSPEGISAAGNMNQPRRGHSATWIPDNRVVIIGGEPGTGASAYNTIEIYDPLSNSFALLGTTLSFARRGHTATLLPTGKILIAGGYNPAALTTALPAELFDPVTSTVMTVLPAVIDRVNHTATRLANGWVLIAGGTLVSSSQTTVSSTAQIFEPELGLMGAFTDALPCMTTSPGPGNPASTPLTSARAFHAASLLGDGNVLLTGGETSTAGPVVTSSAELFLAHTLCFTPTIPMNVARAEHASTPVDCGQIILTGGRNTSSGNPTFLGDLEMFPFTNTNPVIASAFTSSAGSAGFMYIDVTVTDQDGDGGYVLIRYRPGGLGSFRLATIDQQNPSTGPGAYPNMQVFGMPALALPYAFRWNFAADGLSTGQTAEVEVLPVGVTLGTPVHFTVTLP